MRQLKITKSITNRESEALEKYLQEIGREELITSDEEVELAQRIRKGDRKALERLTKANLRFVVSVAKQYQNQGMSLPDLINEGNLGLIKAAEKFDETRGFKFISYAVWWIRQSILQAIAEQSRIVRAECLGGVKIFLGVYVIAYFAISGSAVEYRLEIRGTQANCVRKLGNGVSAHPHIHIQRAQVIAGFGQIGVDFQGTQVIVQGVLAVLCFFGGIFGGHTFPHQRPVGQRRCMRRVLLDELVIQRKCLGIVAFGLRQTCFLE